MKFLHLLLLIELFLCPSRPLIVLSTTYFYATTKVIVINLAIIVLMSFNSEICTYKLLLQYCTFCRAPSVVYSTMNINIQTELI